MWKCEFLKFQKTFYWSFYILVDLCSNFCIHRQKHWSLAFSRPHMGTCHTDQPLNPLSMGTMAVWQAGKGGWSDPSWEVRNAPKGHRWNFVEQTPFFRTGTNVSIGLVTNPFFRSSKKHGCVLSKGEGSVPKNIDHVIPLSYGVWHFSKTNISKLDRNYLDLYFFIDRPRFELRTS